MALSAVEGSGSIQIRQLLDWFGTVERVFEVDRCEASSLPLFNPALASRVQLVSPTPHVVKSQGIELLCPQGANYPDKQRNFPIRPKLSVNKGKFVNNCTKRGDRLLVQQSSVPRS